MKTMRSSLVNLTQIKAVLDTLNPLTELIYDDLHSMDDLGIVGLIAPKAHHSGIDLIEPSLHLPIVLMKCQNGQMQGSEMIENKIDRFITHAMVPERSFMNSNL